MSTFIVWSFNPPKMCAMRRHSWRVPRTRGDFILPESYFYKVLGTLFRVDFAESVCGPDYWTQMFWPLLMIPKSVQFWNWLEWAFCIVGEGGKESGRERLFSAWTWVCQQIWVCPFGCGQRCETRSEWQKCESRYQPSSDSVRWVAQSSDSDEWQRRFSITLPDPVELSYSSIMSTPFILQWT